jgi:hypothetical protein
MALMESWGMAYGMSTTLNTEKLLSIGPVDLTLGVWLYQVVSSMTYFETLFWQVPSRLPLALLSPLSQIICSLRV